MRISSLGSSLALAAVLLFSSTVFAQRHEASAPSSPPPSPPPSAAPSPAPASAPSPAPSPAPAPSAAPSAPPSVSVSHSGEVSAPVSARAPENHVDSSASPAANHLSGSTFTHSSPGGSAPVAHAPESGVERVAPDSRITGGEKVTPATRIGETSPEKERIAKPGEPDLRRRICVGADCKEPVLKANPPQSDLRHRICPGGVCRCPPGQTTGKGGCVAAPVDNQPVYQNQYQDQYQYQYQCPAGQWWNGTRCTSPAIGCAGITSRAELLLTELRALAAEVRDACTNDPSSTDCNDATMRRDGALQRYRMLQNEATPDCRQQLPEPPL